MDQSKWISVKDKMPEDKTPKKYFLVSCYFGLKVALFSHGKFVRPYNHKPFGSVTHYQPLPEPPPKQHKSA